MLTKITQLSLGDPDYKGITPGAKVEEYFLWPEGHEEVLYSLYSSNHPRFNCFYILIDLLLIIIHSHRSFPNHIYYLVDHFN